MASASATTGSGYRALFDETQRMRSLAIVLMLLIATLDVLIVATAMPTILQQLGDVELYSWVFSAYNLSNIAALPVFGALTGRWGVLRTMALAVAVFAVGSVVAALAGSMLMLVIGRAVQGLGAGGLFALPNLIIARYYPDNLRPRAIALSSGVWGVSALAGPLAGGVLLDLWGWHAIFWVNLPICAVIMLLGALGLRGVDQGDPHAAPANLHSPLLLTLAAGLLLVAPAAERPYSWALAVGGLVSAVAYMLAERRSRFPIVPAEVWRAAGPLGGAIATLALISVGFFAAETFLPLLLQTGRGLSASVAGALISVGSLAWMTGTFWVSRHDDLGPRRQTLLGLAVILAGVAGLLALIWLALPTPLAFVFWGLGGLGMGILVPSCTTVVLDVARGAEAGRTTAAGQLMQNLGISAGAALAGALAALGFGPEFDPRGAHSGMAPEAARALIERGVSYALLFSLAVLALALLLARRLPERRLTDAGD
ncbi:MAG TPA: MFS transporter [Roseiflexaceae bacterium]|nr:MFS transporter [Roseiflexaceae bacterium]